MKQEVRLTSLSHGAGCACKLDMTELARVLSHVPVTSDPNVLVGLQQPDDSAVYRVSDDVAIVQSVDFFTPIVDDPYDWGRIAATNALSDIYAMGARPSIALNLVGWPRDLDTAILGRVLEGASKVCSEAGVTIVGGHSVDDPEPKYGLAVTGTIHPARVLHKKGVSLGDDLVLTKPIGTGIVATALKQDRAEPEWVAAAVESMTTLNRAASEIVNDVGANAMTDVTGFGLAGHLLQMLGDSAGAELEFSSIPLLEGALELARAGVYPGGSTRNLEAASRSVDTGSLSDEQSKLLFDAQTSGGLLISVPRDRTRELLSALHAEGVSAAARIGSVVEGSGRITVSE